MYVKWCKIDYSKSFIFAIRYLKFRVACKNQDYTKIICMRLKYSKTSTLTKCFNLDNSEFALLSLEPRLCIWVF